MLHDSRASQDENKRTLMKNLSCCFFSNAALPSLGYEKTCVLFNAAALASQIASEQNLDSEEGLKNAAKFYQVNPLPHCYVVTYAY